mmetsp:Transcript_17366/g.26758  ORF Transcript_17366/g.26758 Transcript_17366/m.26758 type:complete len:197 (+) Transcript_17366:118-708(+)
MAQYLQITDFVFSLLKITRNNPATVFQQILSRVFVIYMVFPYSDGPHFGVFMTVLAWSFTEVVRFIFYSLKLVNMGSPENTFSYIIGLMRYNLFIILYPIGVSGELICCYFTYKYTKAQPPATKPFTVTLPNTVNFGFDFCGVLMILIPITYLFCFPPLYMHMWVQRAKFNKEAAEVFSKASLKVPADQQVMKAIP